PIGIQRHESEAAGLIHPACIAEVPFTGEGAIQTRHPDLFDLLDTPPVQFGNTTVEQKWLEPGVGARGYRLHDIDLLNVAALIAVEPDGRSLSVREEEAQAGRCPAPVQSLLQLARRLVYPSFATCQNTQRQ